MTLTEYMNQTTIERQHNVVLELSEVEVTDRLTIDYVTIPDLGTYELDGRIKTFNYGVLHGTTTLRTLDGDGNVKGFSCFKMKEPITKEIQKNSRIHLYNTN